MKLKVKSFIKIVKIDRNKKYPVTIFQRKLKKTLIGFKDWCTKSIIYQFWYSFSVFQDIKG